jgi:hypothetical protein
MKLNTSTEALAYLIGAEVLKRSKSGEYTSDSHLKSKVDSQYKVFPEYFGLNSEGTGPSSLSVIQGSRRSGLTFIRQKQDNLPIGNGVLRYLSVYSEMKYRKDPTTGENYYYIDGVLQDAQLSMITDPNYVPEYKKDSVNRTEDIHTTIQYELTGIAKLCGYNVYIPNSDRNKRIKDGQTINQDFSDILVNDFNGINSRADDIDCIWIDDNGNPIKAFEVEHSTGVDSGMSRMSSLQTKCPCYIVGTQEGYVKKFKELIETSYKNTSVNFYYLNHKQVAKEYYKLNEKSDVYSTSEVINRINKKFK